MSSKTNDPIQAAIEKQAQQAAEMPALLLMRAVAALERIAEQLEGINSNLEANGAELEELVEIMPALIPIGRERYGPNTKAPDLSKFPAAGDGPNGAGHANDEQHEG